MDYEESWRLAGDAALEIEKHYDHWVAIARGLNNGRLYNLEHSGAESEASPRYRTAYKEWTETHPWAKKWAGPKKKSFRSKCYWLIENLERVERWRATLDPADRDRWSAPETVWRHYRFVATKDDPVDPDPQEGPTWIDRRGMEIERLERELTEARAEIERYEPLEQELTEEQAEVDRLTLELTHVRAELTEEQAEVGRLRLKLRDARAEIASLRHEVDRLTSELSQQHAR